METLKSLLYHWSKNQRIKISSNHCIKIIQNQKGFIEKALVNHWTDFLLIITVLV